MRHIPALRELEVLLRPAGSAPEIGPLPMSPDGEEWVLSVPDLPDGLYRVMVRTVYGGPGSPIPVEDVFEVYRQA